MNPKCCGKESRLVVHSVNLQYLFCDVCKEEVTDKSTATELRFEETDELLAAADALMRSTLFDNSRAWKAFKDDVLNNGQPVVGATPDLDDVDEFLQSELFELLDDNSGADLKVQDHNKLYKGLKY